MDGSSHRARHFDRTAPLFAALALALALAPAARAGKFQMSGTWLVRKGHAFLPLQFGGGMPSGSQVVHVSMGSWTEAPFFPTRTPMGGMSSLAQVIRDAGAVTTTGFAGSLTPGTLRIKQHRFQREHLAVVSVDGPNGGQITTMLQIDAPYASATLMASGGPGSFTWCPLDPACTAGGALATLPGTHAMTQGRHGRVVYAAGANRFGGTLQLGLRYGGLVSVVINQIPFWVAHAVFLGSGPTLWRQAVGGGANDAPSVVTHYLHRPYVTAPTMVPCAGCLFVYPGPFVTTLWGNTWTMPSGVKYRLAGIVPTMAPSRTDVGQYTTSVGFPHTTGTVLAQQKTGTGGDDRFSVMGSDARTALGAGNLNLVAGGLARRNQPGTTGIVHTSYGQFDELFLVLAPPTPSLSPAGLAAAALLVLLGAGYAHRRRLW